MSPTLEVVICPFGEVLMVGPHLLFVERFMSHSSIALPFGKVVSMR